MRNLAPMILLVALGCGESSSPHPKEVSSSPAKAGGIDTDNEIIGDVAPNHPLRKEIAQAKGKLARLEKRHADLQELIDTAQAERDDIVARLREMGVKSSADLKGKTQAKQLTDALQKSVREIEGLQRDDARFAEAVTQTKSLIRRLERAVTLEGAGVGEDELAQLAEKSLELDGKLDGDRPQGPADPIQQADVLDRELGRKLVDGGRPPRPRTLAAQLVGKWQVTEGKKKGTIEFTKGGTALVIWSDGLRNALGESERRATLKYALSGSTLRLEEPGDGEYRQKQAIKIEVISPDEMIFVVEKRAMSFDWLEGRIKRVK